MNVCAKRIRAKRLLQAKALRQEGALEETIVKETMTTKKFVAQAANFFASFAKSKPVARMSNEKVGIGTCAGGKVVSITCCGGLENFFQNLMGKGIRNYPIARYSMRHTKWQTRATLRA